MADGSTFTGIAATGIAGSSLTDAGINALARAAHAVAILKLKRRKQSAWERVSASMLRSAHVIIRDYLHQTKRGIQRANRQLGAGVDPSIVLTVAGLASAVRNYESNSRRTKRARWRADKKLLGEAIGAGAIVVQHVAGGGDDDQAEVLEVVDPRGDPWVWLCSDLDRREAEAAEWRSMAPPGPRRAARKPRQILHLRRAAGGAK